MKVAFRDNSTDIFSDGYFKNNQQGKFSFIGSNHHQTFSINASRLLKNIEKDIVSAMDRQEIPTAKFSVSIGEKAKKMMLIVNIEDFNEQLVGRRNPNIRKELETEWDVECYGGVFSFNERGRLLWSKIAQILWKYNADEPRGNISDICYYYQIKFSDEVLNKQVRNILGEFDRRLILIDSKIQSAMGDL